MRGKYNSKITYTIILLAFLSVFCLSFHGQGERQVNSHEAASAHEEAPGAGGHGGHGSEAHGGHGSNELPPPATLAQTWRANLPLWVSLFPLLGAFLIILIREKSALARNVVVVGTVLTTFYLLLLMYTPVVTGIEVMGKLYRGLYHELSFLPGFNLTFRVDPAGLLVAAVTLFLWTTSSIYAISYMTIEEDRSRYDFVVLASLAANVGVLMAGDFMTLFIFFEGMVIFPYAMVAHKQEGASLKGANYYLYLGSATGLSLLAGMILLYYYTGSVAIQPMAEKINQFMPGGVKYWVALLLILGFGGKAGLFAEHCWLPQAHPVAPSCASALLSGAMIKAGAYGIFRVACMVFTPANANSSWVTSQNIGYALIWVGVVTMFLGVLNALISENSKQMLAYHSVSQMGYIVIGIGCAGYMGAGGAMGLAGAFYHIVNHALFKSLLFLTVGAVYFRTHELNMYKLGGLTKLMPLTCVAMLVGVCGISGIPLFNGFASKTILHHAVFEAIEFSHELPPQALPTFGLRWAEIIFMITAGGTFASNIKLWMLTFVKKRPQGYDYEIKPAPMAMKVSLVLGSAAVILVGLFPNWILNVLIGPALAYFKFDPNSHPYHVLYNLHSTPPQSIIPLLYPVSRQVADSLSQVVHNLLGGGAAVMLGGMYFILGVRFGWFHTVVPEKLSVEYYYLKIFNAFKRICVTVAPPITDAANCLVTWVFVKLDWVNIIITPFLGITHNYLGLCKT